MTFLELKKILFRIYSRIKGVKDDRYYLLKNFPKNGSGIEIGVWKGDFTRRLLRQSIPSKIFLVDPYSYYPEFERAWFGNSKFNQSGMDAVYMKVKSRFRRQIDKGKIKRYHVDHITKDYHTVTTYVAHFLSKYTKYPTTCRVTICVIKVKKCYSRFHFHVLDYCQ